MELLRWDYSEFSDKERDRANELETALSPQMIFKSILSRFNDNWKSGKVRIGWERSTKDCSHQRAVLQFHVGATLYNQFFNAASGYRGHFRASVGDGLRFNAALISAIRNEIFKELKMEKLIFDVAPEFQQINAVIKVSKEHLCSSLNPFLAKLWRTDVLIEPSGVFTEFTPGMGDLIILEPELRWKSLIRDEDQAWIELKGGFLSNNLLYQIKSPGERAFKLHNEGTA